MRRPGRQPAGSGKVQAPMGKKNGKRGVSIVMILNAALGAAILISGAAHFAVSRRPASATAIDDDTGEAGADDFASEEAHEAHEARVAAEAEAASESAGAGAPASRAAKVGPGGGGTEGGGDGGGRTYHIVFSTDCSKYQHWQSYVLFYSAMKVGQPGRVTRIASGCTDEEAQSEREWHDRHIRGAMSERFGIHLTPHFSSVKKDGKVVGDYEFFNKPFGLRHWMEHGEGMGVDPDTGRMKGDEDTIVILLDPDQVLLRPFSDDFSNDEDTIVRGAHRENRRTRVEHGTPFGQLYGLGSGWLKFDLNKIIGEGDSPAKHVTMAEAQRDYPAGPPYLATTRDMYRIAVKWTEFVPRVHEQYPHLLAEMYAYCIAAAHLGLPHQIVESMMVSNTEMNGEGWDFVDKVPAEEVCEHASKLDHRRHALPGVLHHCQRYMLGKHFFGKRRLPKDFFTCESPMLVEVPGDAPLKYDYRVPPPPHKPPGQKKPIRKHVAKREAFMLCALTAALNEASEYFKRHACEGVEGTSYEKSMDLWHVPRR